MWVQLANENDMKGVAGVDAAAVADEDRRTLIAQGMSQASCWIAGRDDDRVEGYLVLTRRHLFGRDFVSLVEVKSSARRLGMASALFHAAEAGATTRQVFTSTNESNGPMRALLGSRGYEQAGAIDHLDPGDPELVFVKYLR